MQILNYFTLLFALTCTLTNVHAADYNPERYNVKQNFDDEIKLQRQSLLETIEDHIRNDIVPNPELFFIPGNSNEEVNYEQEINEFTTEYLTAFNQLIDSYFVWVDGYNSKITAVPEELLQRIYNSPEPIFSFNNETFGDARTFEGYQTFAAYLYNVALTQIDAVSWKKLQLLKIIEFHYKNNRSVVRTLLPVARRNSVRRPYFKYKGFQIDETKTAQIQSITPFKVVPYLLFDELIVIDFFKEEFRQRSSLQLDPDAFAGATPPFGQVSLKIKSDSFENLVQYNELTVQSFGGNGGIAAPQIIEEATCIGECVVIDKSSFSDEIGAYSYVWQILFFDDVIPDKSFLKVYNRGLGSLGNSAWSLWATMIAFPPSSDGLKTTRSTQTFKDLLNDIEESIRGRGQ